MVSVRKRGKVYEYRFEIATVEGTRKWITKSGYPTKAEVFKEGAKAYNDFYYNGQKTQLRENMSYADFLDYWIDNYASFNLHYSTTISYINIIKNHVKPRVEFYKLWQLDTRLLQEFINKIYVEYGFSKNYMASILKVVKGSLKYACYTLNYINTNPAEHVHAPRIDKIGKDPAHIFTQEEIERILDRFKGTHSIYYAFLTVYYTGMRVSEVYGLTWDCVDFEKKTLIINKNIIKKNQYGLPKRKNITKGHSVGVWYYGPISKVVPNFKYVGNVNLRGKSKSEKLALITQYVNAGYFVTEEVKGATPGNQHWVAVTGVNGNNVIMVDPASNQTDMWSAYEWSKSSQFNYFKAE